MLKEGELWEFNAAAVVTNMILRWTKRKDLVENIEDAFDLGLDGSRIFQVLQVGCDCIVVRDVQPMLPIDQRRITIDCKNIVAIVGAPGTGDNNGL